MPTDKRRLLIAFFLICNLLLLFVFLIDFFWYHDAFTLPDSFFHKLTDMDWVLMRSKSNVEFNRIDIITFAVGFTVSIMNGIGIHILLFGWVYGHVVLPIPLTWKIMIPLIGLVLYAPIFYSIKYQADYYHLYMQLAPTGYFSFVLLALGATGLKNLRKQN